MFPHSSTNDNESVITDYPKLQPLQVRLSRLEAETHLRKTDKVGSEEVLHGFQTPTKNLTPLPTSEQGGFYFSSKIYMLRFAFHGLYFFTTFIC